MSPSTREHAAWLAELETGELRRIVEVLHRVHRLIAVMTDLDRLLERVMEESAAAARAGASSLMLYDAAAEELYFHVALGEAGDQQALKREVRLSLDQGIAGTCARLRESINVPDVAADERFFADADKLTQFQTRSILAVPLLDRDELIGVVEVLNKEDGNGFTAADQHVLEIMGSVVATAIQNARLIEENLQQARLAALGEAVAGLSHFTKNIISGMNASIDLIDGALSTGNTESLERSWPVLKRCSMRISNLVEDMLAFSKEREPVREACDVEELLRETIATFDAYLLRQKVTLHLDAAAGPEPAWVDSRAIVRCLLNFLVNAADAVPREGGEVWVTAHRIENGTLAIEVADNGPGVPEELRGKLFDPFFSTKGSKGTGLGLAVVQKAAKEHGGGVFIDDREGGGAVFRLEVPAGEEEGHSHGGK